MCVFTCVCAALTLCACVCVSISNRMHPEKGRAFKGKQGRWAVSSGEETGTMGHSAQIKSIVISRLMWSWSHYRGTVDSVPVTRQTTKHHLHKGGEGLKMQSVRFNSYNVSEWIICKKCHSYLSTNSENFCLSPVTQGQIDGSFKRVLLLSFQLKVP